VKWTDEDGNSCKKLYSSYKHGFEVARQLAIDQRSRVERKISHMYIVASKMDMERIRQFARELNVDMVNRGIDCLPRDIRKDTGSIYHCHLAGGRVT